MHRRKRIVITTFGSFGDIHPYMAIASELRLRGHDPVIATMRLYREKIENAGLRFASVRPEIPAPQQQDQALIDRIMEPRSGPKFLMEEVIFPAIRESYADLLRIVEGHDLFITHPATFAGPLVAYKTRINWISTVLAPTSFLSAYDPPVPPFWPWLVQLKRLGPAFMKVAVKFAKQSYHPASIDELRRELNIPDYGNPVFEGQHSSIRALALFSSLFAQQQPDWPVQTRITGFAFYDDETQMSPELCNFLNEGPAPIVFTLGSSAVWVARDFFDESIRAAKLVGRRAVLLIGDERNMPFEPLTRDILAVNYAPYEALLPGACLVVHHGGIGTTSQALRAGTPTLIVPFAFDQFDNAAHATRLGTSKTIYRAKYAARHVAKHIRSLLSEPRYAENAKRVASLLRREHGVKKACDSIEDVLLSGRAVRETDGELTYASGN